ncbi:hypothetical protein CaCOL14_010782 [Colletotrichum acutatum]
MNGTNKAPDPFPAPNQSQLTPVSMPALTPPKQVPAHDGAEWEFLQGMDITMQGYFECLGRQMQTWKGSYSLDSRRGAPQQLVANAPIGLKGPNWRSPSSGQPKPQFPGQGPSHQQPKAQLKAQMKISGSQLEENKKKRKRDGQRRKERKLEQQQKEQQQQLQKQQLQELQLQQLQQQQLLQYQQLQHQQQLRQQQLQAQQQSQPQSQLQSQLQSPQSQGADHWRDLDWLVNSGLGTAAMGQEQIDLLFDEMDGSDDTQQEQMQAFDQMMMSSVPHPNVDAPELWVPPPPTTFEDVFRQQDEEDGVRLGPYSSMLFGRDHSMSGRE